MKWNQNQIKSATWTLGASKCEYKRLDTRVWSEIDECTPKKSM